MMPSRYQGSGSVLVPVSGKEAASIRRKRRREGAILDKSEVLEKLTKSTNSFKTPEIKALLFDAISRCSLFQILFKAEQNSMINAMRLREVEDELYAAGDIGDTFYVINKGAFRFLDKEGNKKYVKVKGDFLGEMGLFHDNPRDFTVICEGKGEVWELKRADYRNILVRASQESANRIRVALGSVEIFKGFSKEQLNNLADVAQVVTLQQGVDPNEESGSKRRLYIVLSGSVNCIYKNPGCATKEVEYVPGDFFGNFMTAEGKGQDVSIVPKEPTECIIIAEDEFVKYLGPVEEAMNYDERLAVIQSFKGFDRLDSSYLSQLVNNFEVKTYEDGYKIIEEGYQGFSFFHIQKGTVRVDKRISNSTSADVSTLSEGEFFGEQSLLTNEPTNADVTAVGQVVCYVLSREEFNSLSKPLKNQLLKVLHVRNRRTRLTKVRKTVQILSNVDLIDLKPLEILGSGKYGLVKLVKSPALAQPFALKTLQKGRIVRDNQVAETLMEKEILLLCDHPFLVKLFRTYKDSAHVHFLLEYVQGGELFSLLHSRRRLTEATTKFYAACMVEALGYLHRNSVIYRDMKPENTMIDSRGYIRLVDMGFARKLDFKTFTMCGTPQYIAPEILFRRGYNKSVDYWALGIVLFELVAGFTPFYDRDHNVMYEKIIHHKSIPFPEHFPKDMKEIVSGLLRKRSRSRLGMQRGGVEMLRRQEWFNDIDWSLLYNKGIEPPWQPKIEHPLDTSYFLEYDLNDSPMLEEFEGDKYKDDPLLWEDF